MPYARRVFACVPRARIPGLRMSSKEHGKLLFPVVSVVMPVHDMPMTLVRRALRSVHRQNYSGAIETILWDDGSRNPYYRDAYAALESWPDSASVPPVTASSPRTVPRSSGESPAPGTTRSPVPAPSGCCGWTATTSCLLTQPAPWSLRSSGREILRHRAVPCHVPWGVSEEPAMCPT
jgi:cellulose synthase/poly-beta-1,6-N-acetylglucosamine synthase-like glycosyltransferase